MFKSTKAKTPAEYIRMQDTVRQADLKMLDKLIRKTLPKQKPYMLGGMIGYGKFHYKSPSGREGDWALIALANQKNYISLYVCAASKGQYVAEKYRKDLPKANIGKSCIRFKKLAGIDVTIIEKILREAQKTGFTI